MLHNLRNTVTSHTIYWIIHDNTISFNAQALLSYFPSEANPPVNWWRATILAFWRSAFLLELASLDLHLPTTYRGYYSSLNPYPNLRPILLNGSEWTILITLPTLYSLILGKRSSWATEILGFSGFGVFDLHNLAFLGVNHIISHTMGSDAKRSNTDSSSDSEGGGVPLYSVTKRTPGTQRKTTQSSEPPTDEEMALVKASEGFGDMNKSGDPFTEKPPQVPRSVAPTNNPLPRHNTSFAQNHTRQPARYRQSISSNDSRGSGWTSHTSGISPGFPPRMVSRLRFQDFPKSGASIL